MEPNETQPNNPQDDIQMTNDELAAAMGFMTTLGDQQMMAQQEAMEGEQTQESAQGGEETGESQKEPMAEIESLKTEIMDELKTLREEVKSQGDGKQELAELKKQIEEILNSSD